MASVDVSISLAYVGGIVAAVVLTGLAALNVWLAVRAFRWIRSAVSGESVDLAGSVKRSGRGGGGGGIGGPQTVASIAKAAVTGGFLSSLLSSCRFWV